MVGGTIVDIVKVSADKWWVNCADFKHGTIPDQCAVYLNPTGLPIEVGDSLWWQGRSAYWTPRSRAATDIELPRIGFSGVPRPDARTLPTEGREER